MATNKFSVSMPDETYKPMMKTLEKPQYRRTDRSKFIDQAVYEKLVKEGDIVIVKKRTSKRDH